MTPITINPMLRLTADDYDETTQAEMTGRLLPGNDDRTEWHGYGTIAGLRARAVYYTTPLDAVAVEGNGGDWGALGWNADHIDIMTDDGVVVVEIELREKPTDGKAA